MASNSATHRHGLSMHPVLDIRCTDWKSATDHQGTLTETIKEYNLSVDVALVKSAVNRADAFDSTVLVDCCSERVRTSAATVYCFCAQYRPTVDHEYT